MKIDPLMNLEELAQHMGSDSHEEAARLRDLLVQQGKARTEDYSGQEWAEVVIQASGSGKK